MALNPLVDILNQLKKGNTSVAADLETSLLAARESKSNRTAIVESAIPLTPSQQTEITIHITSKFPTIFHTDFHVNQQLLAGLKLTVGDYVYDFSLAKKLDSYV